MKWQQFTMMMIISALLDCASLALATEQGSPIFTHAYHVKERREQGGLNVIGRDIFRRNVLASIGGVLAQASIETPQNKGNFVLRQGECPECILVRLFGRDAVYKIGYDDIVPMVLFIEGGGTSLYTYTVPEEADFQVDAGFVSPTNEEGLIALEFRGTKYEAALQFLDLCHALCLEESPPSDWYSYIKHDAEQRYSFSLVAGTMLSVSGGVLRTYWKENAEEPEEIIITGEVAISPIDRLAERESVCIAQNGRNESDHCTDLERVESLFDAQPRDLFANAHHLYRTLALLRTAKQSTPSAWSEFLEHLTSETLVVQNLPTWDRYTDSFCKIYGDQCE